MLLEDASPPSLRCVSVMQELEITNERVANGELRTQQA